MARFEKLFEPITVGTITLKNRIAMSSMATNTANDEGIYRLINKLLYSQS